MKGFTLIELLVTLAIIGILAGIAVPQYSSYKKRAYDTVALSTLRQIVLGEETYFLDNEEYFSCSDSQCSSLPGVSPIPSDVSIAVEGDEEQFVGQASHEKGTGLEYVWDSVNGGLQ